MSEAHDSAPLVLSLGCTEEAHCAGCGAYYFRLTGDDRTTLCCNAVVCDDDREECLA